MASVNPWVSFQQVIDKSAQSVVTISANNGDGTSTATTASGGTIIVEGESVSAGSQALIKDGRVIRQVPSLTTGTVEI
ncbi:hypothetical protein [Gynuella sp.]|uniref:hypothetical protein n=1 Tax=Gynuella sp. TaxID=2969146 RepID=UPI003D13C1DB